jgi:(heptosyl)LPS beta-1,4-glucosyltransferase
MGNLTAFLIVRNEQHLLPRCLESLAGAVDAIVALDTGSRDGTPGILARAAREGGSPPLRWDRCRFTNFGRVRQAALDMVATEWALWIDADEKLSPALSERLQGLRAGRYRWTGDAYEIRLVNRVYGRDMRGRNLAGQYRLRLFRRQKAAISPSLVHEGVVLAPDCRVGRLEDPILHDTLTSWRRYLAKVQLYTDLEVADGGRRFNPGHLLVTGPATLWREFIGRRGYRDGWRGWLWAVITAWSSLLRDLKVLRRTWGRSRSYPKDIG